MVHSPWVWISQPSTGAHHVLNVYTSFMGITRADVDHVARLARLYLSDDERTALTDQLGRIVEFVDQLRELDTTDIEPLTHAADMTNVFADDVPGECLDREAALGNAPRRDESYFLVPAVLGK